MRHLEETADNFDGFDSALCNRGGFRRSQKAESFVTVFRSVIKLSRKRLDMSQINLCDSFGNRISSVLIIQVFLVCPKAQTRIAVCVCGAQSGDPAVKGGYTPM